MLHSGKDTKMLKKIKSKKYQEKLTKNIRKF